MTAVFAQKEITIFYHNPIHWQKIAMTKIDKFSDKHNM